MHYLDIGAKRSKPNLSGSYVNTDEDLKTDSKLPPINNPFDHETEKYIQEMKTGQNNILVAVRTRPLNSKEASISNFETIRILDGKVVVLMDPQNQFEVNDVLRNNRSKEKQYAFDFAFDQGVDTATVFEKTTKFLVPGVLNGFNSTIFAYGATGAGKTFTMLGGTNSPGLMSLTMAELFKQMHANSDTKEFTARISYLEVYNETIRDLLSSEDTALDLREDTGRGIVVAGITEVIAKTSQEVMTMLKIGSKNRTMEPTGANVVSSRSHAVLQVIVEHKDKNQGVTEELTVSKLSLIDLAGSERASNTNNRGQRLIEGANINRSLLALGNCITLLSDRNEKGKGNTHIPYRDSKLTRLLKDSLGGNCRTVMIANVTPSVICFEDTHNTLKYANRTKNIKTSVSRNVLNVENHMEKYTQIISDLKSENDHLKRLLSNHQNLGLSEVNTNRDVGFIVNDALVSSIKQHFDEEMRMKKKIFELELQQDDIEDKLLMMKHEMNISEDKAARERYEGYQNTQNKLSHQIEELRRDYGYLTGKRAQLNAKIQNEKNKDSVTFLVSILKQNQVILENLELQHKEKRVENQVKWKDRQIKYLQNQLGMKEEKNKDSQHLRVISNTPSRLNQDSFNITNDTPNHFGPNDESLSFLRDLDNLESSPQPTNVRGQNQQKQPLFLPSVNHKLSKSSIPPSKRAAVIPRRLASDTNNTIENARHSSVKSLPPSYAPAKYYYKKHEFMQQKAKPFENGDEMRTKKRYGYLQLQDKLRRDNLSNNTSVRELEVDHTDAAANYRPRGFSLDKPGRRRSIKTIPDSSHASTASSNKNGEKKKNLLEDLNNRKDNIGLAVKNHQYSNKMLHREESPYMVKIHQ